MISTKKTIYKITEAISSIKSSISTITTGIGTLANLTTTSKIVVGAINEVDGDLSTLTTTVNNTVHITESGTSGNWTYRKWSDGISECWCQSTEVTLSTANWQAWGQIYEAIVVDTPIDYPTGLFVSAPQVTATIVPTYGSQFYTLISAEMSCSGVTLSTQTPRVYAIRGGNSKPTGDIKAVVNFYAIGKWQ